MLKMILDNWCKIKAYSKNMLYNLQMTNIYIYKKIISDVKLPQIFCNVLQKQFLSVLICFEHLN